MLSDWQIIKAIEQGYIKIEPYNLVNINPNSYDITLSDSFFYNFSVETIDPRQKRTYGKHVTADELELEPQDCILGSSIETITLSNGYVAVLNGKSSVGRHNISIHQTAGYIDAGFSGEITFEIFNANRRSGYILRKGDLIGQLVFFKVAESTLPYNMRASSKYMNEKSATPSLYYKNYQG